MNARDWIDDVIDAASSVKVGEFAVVVYGPRSWTTRASLRRSYRTLKAACQQATRAANDVRDSVVQSYVVTRYPGKLVCYISATTVARQRRDETTAEAQS